MMAGKNMDDVRAQSISIESVELQATISSLGAELVSLRDSNGFDYLWNGDPAWWPSHAPILFPIVGEVREGALKVDGKLYPIGRHGFARGSMFEVVRAERTRCSFQLCANDQTRAHYPFEFALNVDYEVVGHQLRLRAEVMNRGEDVMPVSLGFHPAFRWPLVPGVPREAYAISFEKPEDKPIRRLASGLLAADAIPSPVHDKKLGLTDALFINDALIFDRLSSRRVIYRASTGPSIEVQFDSMPHLGIWSKPGAGFVCIEPWQGFASPEDFDGELKDKPGMTLAPPGTTKRFEIAVGVSGTSPD
jgi:galactose mutarotase-like enzyme